MIDEGLLARARVLINQDRYDEAEKIIGELMSIHPNNDYLLYLLSEINLQKEDYVKAEELIDSAIALSPEESDHFYFKARLYLLKENKVEAERYIKEAIAIYPYEAAYFAFWAHIKLFNKEYEESLNIANQALAIDSTNIFALNTRSTALLKLGRKEESYNTVAEALNEDPNNAYTHANHGWGLLEKGDVKSALNHFSESLKNDPNSPHAQAGMIEALKARFMVYRWFLKYSFWIGNMTSKYQWLFILGFYFGTKLLRGIAKSNAALAPFLYPIIGLLFIIAISTWIINPIGNLLLLLNPFGKHLLNKEEKISSYATGICLLTALLSGVSYYSIGNEGFITLAVVSFTMMIPFSSMFNKPKALFISYTLIMLLVGLLAVVTTFTTDTLFAIPMIIYALGIFAFQFIANYFVIKR
ncbi:hypothetical protein DVK85_10190 [Flavobacterium arcticum]|uniref:Uncharacterized protein n=1 Tax=Flavobacterium arcticum TaxID=1784713 RepID=A0A345HDC3_9FLAO|nr:tetratricopeptide repeat protein [Flavobacterium arcticum]AXG74583.1 hypothetical protein DVK85_10190 [Flavobacterium arcticum]KAF2512297.1 tetratricopeptide repeat protein [Flavobacterium arcticum]